MSTEEQMKFSQRYARFNSQPQGWLGKLLSLVLGATFLVLAFMFSLVALAVVAVGALALWGWVLWKTRKLRQQIREQANSAAQSGYIIDGEATRTADEPKTPLKRLN